MNDFTSPEQFFSSFRVFELKGLLKHLHISANARKQELVSKVLDCYFRNQEAVISALQQMNKSIPANLGNLKDISSRKNKDFPQHITLQTGLIPIRPQQDVYFHKRAFYQPVKVIVSALVLEKGAYRSGNGAYSFASKIEFKYKLETDQQLHLRFNEITGKTSEDRCPYIDKFSVNDSHGSVPQMPYDLFKKKINRKHVDITAFLMSLNGYCKLEFSGLIGLNEEFAIRLEIVKSLNVSDIIPNIPRSSNTATESLLKQKIMGDPNDSEILSMANLEVSLLCPLGKCRIKIPAKCALCCHIQCFDLELFLQMNQKKPSWKCPVCNDSINFENIVIDSLFEKILLVADQEIEEIVFDEDLSWRPANQDVKPSSLAPVNVMQENLNNISIIDLTNSDDEDTTNHSNKPAVNWLKPNNILSRDDVISISDSPITTNSRQKFGY